jgi:glucokinase
MGNKKDRNTILAGDIGGTKTRLGLFKAGQNRHILNVMETYASQEYKSLETIIKDFLHKYPVNIRSACFGVAGPVLNGKCRITNLTWTISASRIKNRFSFSEVRLINDLTATALSIPALSSRELHPLNRVRLKQRSNIGLVAPGTGLGQALLIHYKGEYVPVSSEGGHVDYAPTNDMEVELWRFLGQRYGHASVERVLSGPGLHDIFLWLKNSGRYKEPAWLVQEFRKTDPVRVISQTALAHKAPICGKALEIYISIMGAVSGNLALTAMTTGGMYLGGGIPPKILPALKGGIFMASFVDKGRFRHILEKIPVRVIMNDQAALLGAARYAVSH